MLPIVMQVRSVPRADGEWVRRVSFPDYPGCDVETEAIEEGIHAAYELLVDRIERTGPLVRPDRKPLRADLEPMIELYRSLEH